MDRDANYVVVGAFVLLVVAMGVAFVFWYTDQQDRRNYQRYEIYFQGSVSGLNEGSPVRYLGVNVGQVLRITLDSEEQKRVLVIADIDSSVQIDSRTLASLSLQGITGLLFVDLEQDRKVLTPGPLAQGQRYPVIRAVPSDFTVLLSSLPALTTRTVELVDHVNQVFSDENMRAFKKTLDNARRASDGLPKTVEEVRALVADVQRTSQEVHGAVADLRAMSASAAPEIAEALANVRTVTGNLNTTSQRLDRFVVENAPGLSRFSNQSLPQFEQLLRESREAARDFRDLSRSLRQDPSQLIYEPIYRGVEVPK
jgi:phospholipid/cholesterol/gamma-HCH transport system substrate-binding protein